MKNGMYETIPAGPKLWYRNDLLHREDGPAIEWANGDVWWCLNGKCISDDPKFTVGKLRAYLLLR
jgi:hypothetical protein